MPAVSVVIPTYNHATRVSGTLESVFRQVFTDFEVIVVNDGSPDETDTVLRPWVETGRIRYILQENAGQAAARNRGLAEATGRYIAFLDDDDLWPEDKLAWQVDVLERESGVLVVYGGYARLDGNGSVVRVASGRPHPDGEVYQAFLRGYCMMSPGQALMRADALKAVGGFDASLWGVDDWDLYVRLAEHGQFRYVDRVALHYRVHEGAASRDAVRHCENAWRAMRKHAGWNVGLIRHQLRAGSGYFVPNLLRYAREARARGHVRRAARAYLYATAYRPGLLLGRALSRMLRILSRSRARLVGIEARERPQ